MIEIGSLCSKHFTPLRQEVIRRRLYIRSINNGKDIVNIGVRKLKKHLAMGTDSTAIPIVRVRTIKVLYPGKSKPNTGHPIFYIEKDIVRDMPRSTNSPKFVFERLVAYYISKLHSSKWLLVPSLFARLYEGTNSHATKEFLLAVRKR
jgi:hypothetical protein